MKKSLPSALQLILRSSTRYWTLPFTLTLSLAISTADLLAQSCPIGLIEAQAVGTNFNKFGYGECAPSCPPKYFLQKQRDECGNLDDPGLSLIFGRTFVTAYSIDQATNPSGTMCGWTAPETTVSCNGSVSLSGSGSTTMGTNCDWIDTSPDGSTTACWDSFTDVGCFNVQSGCGDGTGYWCWVAEPYSFAEVGDTCTSTLSEHHVNFDNGYGGTGTYTNKYQLSSEFTDSMLRAQIVGRTPAFPDDSPGNWSGAPTASYGFTGTNHFCAAGNKMRYRVKVPRSVKDIPYEISWTEITMVLSYSCSGTGTTNISVSVMDEIVMGTGDPTNAATGVIHTVPMPTVSGDEISKTITETSPEIINIWSPGAGGPDGGPPGDGGPTIGGPGIGKGKGYGGN